jgi:hypothetical protein
LVSYHAFFLPALKAEPNRIVSRKTGEWREEVD